jgi:hypothetical protein
MNLKFYLLLNFMLHLSFEIYEIYVYINIVIINLFVKMLHIYNV